MLYESARNMGYDNYLSQEEDQPVHHHHKRSSLDELPKKKPFILLEPWLTDAWILIPARPEFFTCLELSEMTFYPLTLSLLINLGLTANIPLKPRAEGEEDSSPDHFHEAVGSLDNFLDTLSDVTHSLDSVAGDLKKVCSVPCSAATKRGTIFMIFSLSTRRTKLRRHFWTKWISWTVWTRLCRVFPLKMWRLVFNWTTGTRPVTERLL